jgi:hypothetical protein
MCLPVDCDVGLDGAPSDTEHLTENKRVLCRKSDYLILSCCATVTACGPRGHVDRFKYALCYARVWQPHKMNLLYLPLKLTQRI